MCLTVPYIPPNELTVIFWSGAAFANHVNHKTQGGWLLGFTSTKCHLGKMFLGLALDGSHIAFPALSGGASQSYTSASGVAEWSEALDSPFSLREIDDVLKRRAPIGITDCRSCMITLYA